MNIHRMNNVYCTPPVEDVSGGGGISVNSNSGGPGPRKIADGLLPRHDTSSKELRKPPRARIERSNLKYFDICNNCGKQGHTFKQCKNPITSFGVIVFRIYKNQRQYLMIRRKDTLGYIDFMRGKYSITNQKYILNMLKQMTCQEKKKLQTMTFDELWTEIWADDTPITQPLDLINVKRPGQLRHHVVSMQCDPVTAEEEQKSTSGPGFAKNPRGQRVPPSSRPSRTLRPSRNSCTTRTSHATIHESTEDTLMLTKPEQLLVDTTKEDEEPEASFSSFPERSLFEMGCYKQEEATSREMFNYLTSHYVPTDEHVKTSILDYLIMTSNHVAPSTENPHKYDLDGKGAAADPSPRTHGGWNEPEWGFPKGRRNNQEKDYDCALREMTEETGYPVQYVKNIKNILPFDETFLGSNYKSYKHRYYLMYMSYENSVMMNNYEKSEVSCMEWKSYDDCIKAIRPYNLEKIRLITNIEQTLSKYRLFILDNNKRHIV